LLAILHEGKLGIDKQAYRNGDIIFSSLQHNTYLGLWALFSDSNKLMDIVRKEKIKELRQMEYSLYVPNPTFT
jgi:hypothetical protein